MNTQPTWMPESQLISLASQLSNAGRWGPHDTLGTLNFISAEKRRQAAGLVIEGRSVSIGKDLVEGPASASGPPVTFRMLFGADSLEVDLGLVDRQDIPISALDLVEIAPHGHTVTHLDAFGHTNFEGSFYNNRAAAENLSVKGLKAASILDFREGVFTRGVLLDIPRSKGVEFLPRGDAITPHDLELAEARGKSRVTTGDAVIVYTGNPPQDSAEEALENKRHNTGLMPECLSWLHDREVALYVGDCNDRFDSPYLRLPLYFHMVCMPFMGLPLLDNPQLAPLASLAAELARYEFLFTCAPLRIPGATASAVNPLCIF